MEWKPICLIAMKTFMASTVGWILKNFSRPEQKFTSLEALKKQLEKDAVKGQEYFRKEK